MFPTAQETTAAQRLAEAILALIRAVEDGQAARRPRQAAPAAAAPRPKVEVPASAGLLSRLEAAKFLSVSPGTVFNHTAPRGPIRSIRIGASIRYSVEDLKRFVEAKAIGPVAPSEITKPAS